MYNPLPMSLVLAAVVLSPKFLRFLFKLFCQIFYFFFLHIEADCTFFEVTASFADFHCRIHIKKSLLTYCASRGYIFVPHGANQMWATGSCQPSTVKSEIRSHLVPNSPFFSVPHRALCNYKLQVLQEIHNLLWTHCLDAGFESKSHFRHIKALGATIFVPYGGLSKSVGNLPDLARLPLSNSKSAVCFDHL